eukprot:TRINITY_DN1609_c0_g1_i1.p3 TRINITY_DN1609_c0_g1~~TRINITY_DN1609_c0_g1_i1.p3  ORF type:complete len:125 (-),score=44.78 TRINITY_DN1609_c0_g1_i1:1735-2109(-)
MEADSAKYLEEKKVMPLMEHLLQFVLVERPENVEEFLANVLIKLRDTEKTTPFLTDLDMENSFRMIDVNQTGFVSKESVVNALLSCGVKEEEIQKIDMPGRMGLEDFKDIFGTALDTLARISTH